MFALAVVAALTLLVSHSDAQSCYTFYEGLCPGPANCMCTGFDSCGGDPKLAKFNASTIRTKAGGCAGSCRTVASGECPGSSSCLADQGSCGGPPPPSPPSPGSGLYGGDVSSPVSEGTFQCTVSNGWSFVIVRSYCSYGGVDPNAPTTLANAAAAGITYRDVYHFPCAGSDAAGQVSDDVNGVGKGNFGNLWFDIETNPSPGCGWSGDTSSNCAFLGQMISAGQSLGISMGVYASSYMWSSIMGDCTVGADNGLKLWYAHYDQNPSFSDFQSFGGWSTPTMKQYWDSVGICGGLGADADWVGG